MNTQPLLNSFHSAVTLPTLSPQSILITIGNRQIMIPTDQLVCMEASGNYTYIYTIDGKRYLVSKTLKSYVIFLEELSFLRPHKSWLINTKYLQSYCEHDHLLKMRGGKEITISRRRIRVVKEAIAPFCKRK